MSLRTWLFHFIQDVGHFFRLLSRQLLHPADPHDRRMLLLGGGCSALLIALTVILVHATFKADEPQIPEPETRVITIDYTQPVRELPDRFPPNTYRPNRREGTVSVSIHKVDFKPERDLVIVDDARVWWESEHDHGDTENDHEMHRCMETPLRRLIELVSAEDGTLKVQDAYRETGIHASRSLHKQGRALDLTCDELGLTRLAQLCWAAGFDWVYHESPRGGGAHIHVSCKPD